jgi:hypothetical protein
VRNGFGITQYASKKRKKSQQRLRKSKIEDFKKGVIPLEMEGKKGRGDFYTTRKKREENGKVSPLL